MEENPDTPIVQIDTVEGKLDGGAVLLTLHFVEIEFMLAFLREANTAQSVISIINAKSWENKSFKSFSPLF